MVASKVFPVCTVQNDHVLLVAVEQWICDMSHEPVENNNEVHFKYVAEHLAKVCMNY